MISFFSPSSPPALFVPLQATEKHFRHLTDGCYPERLGGRRAFGCKALQGKDAKQLNAIRFCSMETNFDFIYSFSRNGLKQKIRLNHLKAQFKIIEELNNSGFAFFLFVLCSVYSYMLYRIVVFLVAI